MQQGNFETGICQYNLLPCMQLQVDQQLPEIMCLRRFYAMLHGDKDDEEDDKEL